MFPARLVKPAAAAKVPIKLGRSTSPIVHAFRRMGPISFRETHCSPPEQRTMPAAKTAIPFGD